MRKLVNVSFQLIQSIRDCLSLLSQEKRNKLALMALGQVLLSFLDLIGVALVGVIAALSVNGVRSALPGSRVMLVLKFLGIDGLSFQNQTVVLGLAAAATLIGRTFLSIYFGRKVLYFLSNVSAEISTLLVKKLLNSPLLVVKQNSSQKILYTVTGGITAITLGVLGGATAIVADIALLITLGIGIGVFDPVLTFSAFLLFFAILSLLYRKLRSRMIHLARINRDTAIESAEWTVEILDSYREAFVRNRRNYYAEQISIMRHQVAQVTAEQSWLPNISKYVIEISVTLGALLLAGFQFATKDATQAIGGLSLFLAAGTRIAPALLRIQQNLFSVNSNIVTAAPTLELIDELTRINPSSESISIFQDEHPKFEAKISLSNVSFFYPGNTSPTISDLSLEISQGSVVALVGPSGAGKSTLVDLILGVLTPSSGDIRISESLPLDSIVASPGAIGYVPQDISIFNGTIRSNLGLGFPAGEVTDDRAWAVLRKANLDEFVMSLPGGLEAKVGDRGSTLSGGQRQRLGIARALITNPKLLILDEATSSLDGKTEFQITESIGRLKGEVTILLIAHRLSTLRDADSVLYLADGKIIGQGTFEEVRNQIADFDEQARIMGL